MRHGLFALLILAGCSDSGTTFAGRYMVVSHTKNPSACATAGDPVSGGDGYFKLSNIDLFGYSVLGYSSCSDAADLTCAGGAPAGAFFGTMGPLDADTWGSNAAYGASGTSDACTFSWQSTRLRHLGDQIQIQVETHQGTESVTQCDSKAGNKLTDQGRLLPCLTLETLTAASAP